MNSFISVVLVTKPNCGFALPRSLAQLSHPGDPRIPTLAPRGSARLLSWSYCWIVTPGNQRKHAKNIDTLHKSIRSLLLRATPAKSSYKRRGRTCFSAPLSLGVYSSCLHDAVPNEYSWIIHKRRILVFYLNLQRLAELCRGWLATSW